MSKIEGPHRDDLESMEKDPNALPTAEDVQQLLKEREALQTTPGTKLEDPEKHPGVKGELARAGQEAKKQEQEVQKQGNEQLASVQSRLTDLEKDTAHDKTKDALGVDSLAQKTDTPNVTAKELRDAQNEVGFAGNVGVDQDSVASTDEDVEFNIQDPDGSGIQTRNA